MIFGLEAVDVNGRSSGVSVFIVAVSPLMSHELRQTLGLITAHRASQVCRLVHFGFELVEKRSGLALWRRDGAAAAGAAATPPPVRYCGTTGSGVCEGRATVERARCTVSVIDNGREIAESALARRQAVVVIRGDDGRVFRRWRWCCHGQSHAGDRGHEP